ncbi:hypothetical protein [Prosthecomicrobium pneumaticum]|uniref:AsmA-like C-terminal domain-containing protein n=1 Tax=Prosthecomicrobium pneumaticum TaxID=81895 RepID=A0A7W9CSH2_9HYPH|nr:hypothetical protein [Prosthecomicrobium pneumaticum]MBB5751103.1 hypothetical protein [Prosthecomicrobium pneumaticum]
MRKLRLIRAAAIAVVFTAGPAAAAEPVETAIDSWIATIDASPNWTASRSALTVDPAQRTATVTGLRIATEIAKAPVVISFAKVTVFGYEEQPDGAFSAQQITADGGRIDTGGVFDVDLDDVTIDRLAVPSFADYRFDPQRVATSVVKAFAIASRTRADLIRIARVDVENSIEGERSRSSYGTYELRGLADGKINTVTVGPIVSDMPSPEGIIKMRADRIEGSGYDLDAIVHLLDPDRYAGGVGDMQWRIVVGHEAIRNLVYEFPGGSARIGLIAGEAERVRQPPRSFTGLFDALINRQDASPEEIGKEFLPILPDLAKTYSVGMIRMGDLDVVAPEIDRFHLGAIRFSELSAEGLGEFALEDFDLSVPGEVDLGLDRFAFGDVRFPEIEAVIRAAEAQASGVPADPTPLIPTLGFAEVLGFDFKRGAEAGKLDSLRLDLGDYIGPIPTKIGYAMRGLDIPASLIKDPKAQEMLAGLGYDRVAGDSSFRLGWREADQSVTLDGFDLTLEDIGRITASATLRGLTRAAIERPQSLEAALPSLLFESGRLTIEDRSVVGRALAMQAKKMNVSPDTFRNQIVGAVPLALMVLRNPTFQGKLAPALQAFLKAPGTIAFAAAPVSPVPITAIEAAAKSAPQTLPDLLGIQVETRP